MTEIPPMSGGLMAELLFLIVVTLALIRLMLK